MRISKIIEMKQDKSYERLHVEDENAKGFVTSFEGFGDQTEYPIISVEKRIISSKRLLHMKNEKEQIMEVAFLIFTANIDKRTVKRTMSVKEIVNKLLNFNDLDLLICCEEENSIRDENEDFFYLECLNMYPSDDYDCRCDNIERLFNGYHTEAFFV